MQTESLVLKLDKCCGSHLVCDERFQIPAFLTSVMHYDLNRSRCHILFCNIFTVTLICDLEDQFHILSPLVDNAVCTCQNHLPMTNRLPNILFLCICTMT